MRPSAAGLEKNDPSARFSIRVTELTQRTQNSDRNVGVVFLLEQSQERLERPFHLERARRRGSRQPHLRVRVFQHGVYEHTGILSPDLGKPEQRLLSYPGVCMGQRAGDELDSAVATDLGQDG